ncbi:SWIRM domain-containing protein [Thermochaetoides thermophila DSM 1495]|uniref:SWIRM domain-containing protein n=1 Tax=Chaetomium thermophilum (strain DSM 1495 / CBS 144.50 / IMI 039719) TaxID=759272 RepID=G0S0T2_CHATD|nr:SWIRM domain-containing protein [Thermochaetoides thermophila DSM 1495]EGS22642.1 SWIRM domain-containing protein [Thermochaetoides thermophila DSM 1495]
MHENCGLARSSDVLSSKPLSRPVKPCDISNLMSPPEPAPLDMCTSRPSAAASDKASTPPADTRVPLSPPVSPFSKPSNSINPVPATHNFAVKDPILYPATEPLPPTTPGSLFRPASAWGSSRDYSRRTAVSETEQRVINEHIASRPADLFRNSTPPKREDYELALYFKSNCLRMFQKDPAGWLRQERQLLRADRKHTAWSNTLSSSRPHQQVLAPKPVTSSVLAPDTTSAKVPPVRVHKPRAARPKTGPTPRPIRATPTPSSRHDTIHVGATSPEQQPRVRTVAPNREDKDFEALEDLSPPLSSLPPKPNCLKVDWKGNALDLSNDPHRHLLHPDELSLASSLRLDCATYLTSKRRIFLRRLECARIGKEFRKTDAQQACKIDVNKASKLWQAFEKVGWLDIKWMKPYLERS